MNDSGHPRKIGFLLASVHTGSSNRLWSVLADMANKTKDALFVFPGGRLECAEDFEYLRSSVYDLANSENLDGLISWGSSMGGFVSVSEVIRYHDRFEEVPFATIGMKKDGHPDISFDAYAGLQAEIFHCINVHGASKLAFIRGPENHLSAEARYMAYLDSLQQCGLEMNPLLVSDATPWSSGAQALDQLVLERGLVPGKDFDTLVCASDLMMFHAGKRLEELGIVIPDDLRIVGFNDSHESQLLRVPCTTVGMPFVRMGIMAWQSVSQMLSSGDTSGADVLLPADLLVRRSCGCEDSFGGKDKAFHAITDVSSYVRWLAKTFHISDDQVAEKVQPLLCTVLTLSPEAYQELEREFSGMLVNFFRNDGDINLLYEALQWLCMFLPVDDHFRMFVAQRLQPLIGKTQNRVFNLRGFETSQRARKLNSLKCDLLCMRSFSDLGQILHTHLPSLDIDAAFVVLNGDESYSHFIGGFNGETLYELRQDFPRRQLLPKSVVETYSGGIYIVEPLFMENQPLGYFVIRTTTKDGELFEELRSSLSSSIKGTLLMEVANQAREQAERAERSRTEFFTNVSDGLRDPLQEIRRLVTELADPDAVFSIEKEIAKANHLIDLTMSQTGELELDLRLCDVPVSIIPSLLEMGVACDAASLVPAIVADTSRCLQIIEMVNQLVILDGGTLHCTVLPSVDGLVLVLVSSNGRWDPRLFSQDPGFLLAERIMVMHEGKFIVDSQSVRCVFPWPTLVGDSHRSVNVPEGIALYLVSDPDVQLAAVPSGLPPIAKVSASSVVRKEMPLTPPSLILWDAKDVSFDMLSALKILKEDSSKERLPFLCFHPSSEDVSLSVMIESIRQRVSGGPVFIVGDVPSALTDLVLANDIIQLTSLAEYEQKAIEGGSLLVVAMQVSGEELEGVRKSKVGGSIPIVLLSDSFASLDIEQVNLLPRVLLYNTCMVESDGFAARIRGVLGGEDVLPPLTGALVKRAQVVLCKQATSQLSRWQLAEAVNVSEDYLTRIFRKELGLSPWDYLNRYRIHLASQLLRQTSMTINEVAAHTGFQDQAYFCRVFKKVKGCAPGKLRSRN